MPVQTGIKPDDVATGSAQDAGFLDVLSQFPGVGAPAEAPAVPTLMPAQGAAALSPQTVSAASSEPSAFAMPQPVAPSAEPADAGSNLAEAGNDLSGMGDLAGGEPTIRTPDQTAVPALRHDAMQAKPARIEDGSAAAMPQDAAPEQVLASASEVQPRQLGQDAKTAPVEALPAKPKGAAAKAAGDEQQALPAEPGAAAALTVPQQAQIVPLPANGPGHRAPEVPPQAAATEEAELSGATPLRGMAMPSVSLASEQAVEPIEAGDSADMASVSSQFGELTENDGPVLPHKVSHDLGAGQAPARAFPEAKLEQLVRGELGAVYPTRLARAAVDARAGNMGRDLGVEIARAAGGGQDELVVRLTPESLGRVEVRIAFDREGGLRAVLSADQPATTALLQREVPNLVRALADAGIRSDDNSVRFQTNNDGGQTGSWSGDRNQGSQQDQRRSGRQDPVDEVAIPAFRSVRAGSRVDLIA